MTGPGLCGTCRHARIVESVRGSRFVLCERSRSDARFPRYPPLPVLVCTGYARGAGRPAGSVLPPPDRANRQAP